MAYEVKISNFEGPFDLLFHLIEKAEVDIYDIPIAEITNQYLDYIYSMDNMDLDNASEFIVMAATLIHIKSKMLLPKESSPFDEFSADMEDPRAELVEKLIEYKKFKEVSSLLREMENTYLGVMYKPGEIIDDVEEDKLFLNITLDDIINAFNDVVVRYKENHSHEENMDHQIMEEEYTVDDKIESMRRMLKDVNQFSFNKLFQDARSKLEIIITFLALLELIKLREVQICQNTVFSDIIITAKAKEAS